jgi:hypothetical protein
VKAFYEEFSKPETGFSITRHGALGIECKRYLGIEVERDNEKGEFLLSNDHLIKGLLEKVGERIKGMPPEDVAMRDERLSNGDAVKDLDERKKQGLDKLPFRSYLGGLGYIMLSSRPDLAYSYKELARFNTTYGKPHWEALLKTMSYLNKTKDSHKLRISKSGGTRLEAYCDADWNASDLHLSTTGWIVFVGNAPVSWCSQMQPATARSTCEAEFISLSHLSHEVVYLSQLTKSLRIPTDDIPIHCNQGPHNCESAYKIWEEYTSMATPDSEKHEPAMVWSDSTSAISNAKTPFGWLTNKLRHIKTAFHFVKQYVIPNDNGSKMHLQSVPQYSERHFHLWHVRGDDNPADIMTKGMGDKAMKNNQKKEVFQRHARFCLGIRE